MQAQIQTLADHMRSSSAHRGPTHSKVPATAPAVVMQASHPSSQAGSMHQQRQLASAAANLVCLDENKHAGVPGRNTSLAVSVANTVNLNARPTSTQEGAEAPHAASDDDTIEMQAQVLPSCLEGCLRPVTLRKCTCMSQNVAQHRNASGI